MHHPQIKKKELKLNFEITQAKVEFSSADKTKCGGLKGGTWIYDNIISKKLYTIMTTDNVIEMSLCANQQHITHITLSLIYDLKMAKEETK